jgi:hypothetical protein
MGLFSSKPASSSLYGPTPGPSMFTSSTPSPSTSFNLMSVLGKALVVIVGVLIIYFAGLVIYNIIVGANGKENTNILGTPTVPDQAPLPLDGKAPTKISASNVPLSGSDNGVQFWMFIKDWDYNFGKEKGVLIRSDPTNAAISNPKITLHPTDNSLNVSVSIYGGSSSGTSRSTPAASNQTNVTGDVFTCTVENVPLQTWFSVSATVFQRNLDVYINGKLVKSCVLPGVPRPAAGDITVGSAGGFSGQVCNVHSYPGMLGPSDAAAFFAKGTNCASFAQPSSSNTANSSEFTLFGYTYTFGVKDSSGKQIRNYSF